MGLESLLPRVDLAIEAELLGKALRNVSYDVATFAEHVLDDEEGDGAPLLRPCLVLRSDAPDFRWPRRWTPTSAAEEAWATSEQPWHPDILDIADSDLAKNSPSLKQYLELKIRSVLCFAIRQDGRVRWTVLLGSKKPNMYGKAVLEELRARKIWETMRAIDNLLRRRRDVFLAKIRELFSEGLSPEQLAPQIVENLSEEFNWDYVGIYRVEKSRNQFTLVAQHDRTHAKQMSVKSGYTQDIEAGMIGKALRERVCLRADDVTIKPPPHDYIQLEGLPAR